MDARCLIQDFLSERNPDSRYASFDFCYNYFAAFSTCSGQISTADNWQTSCLQLVSYLASWGMYRGSSRLLKARSARHFLPLIELIGSGDLDRLWAIDCDCYTDANIKLMVNAYDLIANKVTEEGQQKLVLVTKIMMGVFGCTPAFDTRATDSLRTLFGDQCGFRRFNENALCCVRDAYLRSKSTIDSFAGKIVTLEFDSGQPTRRPYSKAKILDMVLFQAAGRPFDP